MLKQLRDAPTARNYLADTLPALRSGQMRPAIEIRAVFPRPDWTVLFRLAPGSATETARLITAHHFPNGGMEEAISRLRQLAGAAGRHDPSIGSFIGEDASNRLLLYPFPLDPKMRSLGEAVWARRAGSLGLRTEGVEDTAIERSDPVRYVPGKRCQLRYRLHESNGSRSCVFGKVLRRQKAESLYDGMTRVADWFEKHGDSWFVAPRPVAYVKRWHMVVQERLPGVTLHEAIRRGTATPDHFGDAGRCLAILHRAPLQLDRAHSPVDELQLIEDWCAQLERFGCGEESFLRALAVAGNSAEQTASGPLVAVHRDFYDKQVLVGASRTALIDLDSLAMGLAEIDVANFLAHLQLRRKQFNLPEHQLAQWQTAFLEGYCDSAPAPLSRCWLRFFLAASLFRLACLYQLRGTIPEIAPYLLRASTKAAWSLRKPRLEG